MTIDWTKPVQTNDGLEVRIAATNGPGSYPVVGWRVNTTKSDDWVAACWTKEGKPPTAYALDCLINVPEAPKRFEYVRWVNVYPHGAMSPTPTPTPPDDDDREALAMLLCKKNPREQLSWKALRESTRDDYRKYADVVASVLHGCSMNRGKKDPAKLLIDAGIYDKHGNLTEHYRG